MSVELQIKLAQESFQINSVAMDLLLRGPQGPVARDLAERAIKVESAAKVNATGRPGPKVRTGRLRGSITWRFGEDVEGLYVDIGTNVEYAIYLEMGTSRMPAYPFLLPALEAAT